MTETVETKADLKVYFVTLSYDTPIGGTMPVIARDEEHAREIATKTHERMPNFTIVDVASVEQVEEKEKKYLERVMPQQPVDDGGDKVH
jgi:hypothetical protein